MILPVFFGGLGGVLGLSRGRKRSSFTVGAAGPLGTDFEAEGERVNPWTLRPQNL